MALHTGIKILCILSFASGVLFSSFSQTLSGKVIDEKSAGIKDASVQLAIAHLSTSSGDDGSWSITIPSGIEPFVRKWLVPSPVLKGSTLYFAVNNDAKTVRVNLFDVSGRLLYEALNRKLAPGFYGLCLSAPSLAPGMYAVQFVNSDESAFFKLLAAGKSDLSGTSYLKSAPAAVTEKLEKIKVIIDTVKVSKTGYQRAAVTIGSYADGPLTITLRTITTPFYYLNPPNPCYARWGKAKDCVPGDTNSACRGMCEAANACSPPEASDKANMPKTFICPSFMLYSSEMLQAAKDDAALYGWGDTANPPFIYGVAGHDPDKGGLDENQSTCCQCYQLVFVKPNNEGDSPQPPDSLPYPKPVIVQSFNTAAGGGNNFDIFMAAGGYGAYNACYNDPAFGSTSQFKEFMYDSFPYQNPGSGGIKYLNELIARAECVKGWPRTASALMSSACQEKIKQLCNQAFMKASPQITEYTRRSCIECNKANSLYHQNWQVMVKRVQCPVNLTRVTGCRLKEVKLSLPLPKIQNPDQAKSDGTFKTGYTSTTMQDCCKPTCAWLGYTIDDSLPVDGDWNVFYSCDKNGMPFTK